MSERENTLNRSSKMTITVKIIDIAGNVKRTETGTVQDMAKMSAETLANGYDFPQPEGEKDAIVALYNEVNRLMA